MQIDYKDIKEKRACKDGYLWFLETFGKDKVELSRVIELAPTAYEGWLKTNFRESLQRSTNFKGTYVWRDENNDIIVFHINGSVCRAEKFIDIKEFPSGSFLPVENVMETDRYVVIGAVKSATYKDDIDYLYFYDTEFCTLPNIFLLCSNIKKIYWAHINLGYVFFDLPLYAHFTDRMCKAERLDLIIKNGRLKSY